MSGFSFEMRQSFGHFGIISNSPAEIKPNVEFARRYRKCKKLHFSPSSSIRQLGVSEVWIPSSTVSHHTSALCASCSVCSLPATEGNHLEHLRQWDDPTSMRTNVCLSVVINETRSHCRTEANISADSLHWSCLLSDEFHLKFRPENFSKSKRSTIMSALYKST